MKIERLSQPTSEQEPISLDLAKAHCRVNHAHEDELFKNVYIPQARAAAENFCSRQFAPAKFRTVLRGWPSTICLPCDTTSVVSIAYTDMDGARITIDPADYTFDPINRTIRPVDNWPGGTSPTIVFWSGPDLGGSPEGIIDSAVLGAILQIIADAYDTRESQIVGTIITSNPVTERMLWPSRVELGV